MAERWGRGFVLLQRVEVESQVKPKGADFSSTKTKLSNHWKQLKKMAQVALWPNEISDWRDLFGAGQLWIWATVLNIPAWLGGQTAQFFRLSQLSKSIGSMIFRGHTADGEIDDFNSSSMAGASQKLFCAHSCLKALCSSAEMLSPSHYPHG